MASQDPNVWQILNDSNELKEIKREKTKVSLLLLMAAAVYYMGLLLGASFLKSLFILSLGGELNFGTVFALSQYPFCGLLALIYVIKMRAIDRKIDVVVYLYQQEIR